MTNEYHKIQTVYWRDPETNFKTLLDGQFTTPEFDWLKDNHWVGTEKIDGTNIRVFWDGEKVTLGGKTDNAQIPAFLIAKLQEHFTPEKMSACFGSGGFCLYGEGYGAKIQSGRHYIPDGCDFILFDVHYNDVWLERANVVDIASKLGIDVVPVAFKGDLVGAVEFAKQGVQSAISSRPMEGLVLRPEVELRDRRGHRIITKVKHKDFSPNR